MFRAGSCPRTDSKWNIAGGKPGNFSNLKYSHVSSSNSEKDYQGKQICFRKRPGAWFLHKNLCLLPFSGSRLPLWEDVIYGLAFNLSTDGSFWQWYSGTNLSMSIHTLVCFWYEWPFKAKICEMDLPRLCGILQARPIPPDNGYR